MEQQDPLDVPHKLKRRNPRNWGSSWLEAVFEALVCIASLPIQPYYTIYPQDYPDQAIARLRIGQQYLHSWPTYCTLALGQIHPHDDSFQAYGNPWPKPICNTDSEGIVMWSWRFRIPGHDEYTASLSNLCLQGSTVTGTLTCKKTYHHRHPLPERAVDPIVSECLPALTQVIIR